MGAHPFPNIIEAIDGSHIPTEPPYDNSQAYYNNRKKFYSFILQGVCNDKLQFIDINVGWPGRVHDVKVLRHSSLWEKVNELCQHGRFHLLGDVAYPLRRWLLTPYRNTGDLNRKQLCYNKSLSSKRQVIERTFGLLKGRFRRLKYVNRSKSKAFAILSQQHAFYITFVFPLGRTWKSLWKLITM